MEAESAKNGNELVVTYDHTRYDLELAVYQVTETFRFIFEKLRKLVWFVTP